MLLRKIVIGNFRGFTKLEVELDRTTVLIGENNTGKTALLDALRFCLERPLSRKGLSFDDYDYHLSFKDAQPGDAGSLVITLDFAEETPEEWSEELVQALADIVVVHDGDFRHITIRVTSHFDKNAGEFVTDWDFLDSKGDCLSPKTKRGQVVSTLQQLRPFFFLNALRDPSREFQLRSSYWAPFLRQASIPDEVRRELEAQIRAVNERVLSLHTRLHDVKDHLKKVRQLVALGMMTL